MKTSLLRLLGLMLAVIPITAAAQNNIKSAFDAIIKCPDAKIIESHTLAKDPSTGSKTVKAIYIASYSRLIRLT